MIRIETERLYVRQMTDEDFGLMSLIWTSWFPTLFLKNEAALNSFLQGCWEDAQSPTILTGLIFLKERDVFCGRVNMQHTDWEVPEIGVDILHDYCNQGYGPEAITGFVNWYGETYHVPIVKARIMAMNAHSRHVFEKLGAAYSSEKSMLSDQMQSLRAKQLEDKSSAIADIRVQEYILRVPIGQDKENP